MKVCMWMSMSVCLSVCLYVCMYIIFVRVFVQFCVWVYPIAKAQYHFTLSVRVTFGLINISIWLRNFIFYWRVWCTLVSDWAFWFDQHHQTRIVVLSYCVLHWNYSKVKFRIKVKVTLRVKVRNKGKADSNAFVSMFSVSRKVCIHIRLVDL